MALVTLFNADRVPVHLDAVGHVLGAGEHGEGDPNDPVVIEAIAAGRLIVVDEPVAEPVPTPDPGKPKGEKQPTDDEKKD